MIQFYLSEYLIMPVSSMSKCRFPKSVKYVPIHHYETSNKTAVAHIFLFNNKLRNW